MAVTVTLAGSYSGQRFKKMKYLKQQLEEAGVNVLYPPKGEMDDSEYGFFESDEKTGDPNSDFARAEMKFLHGTLRKCDAIIFCNYDGHLGQMSSYESYFFISAIITEGIDKYYNSFGSLPIYMTDEVNYDDCSDFLGELFKSGISSGFIKIGIDNFYDDFNLTKPVSKKEIKTR